MSKRHQAPDPDRRKFLKGATLAGAAAAVTPVAAGAQGAAPAATAHATVKALPPGPIQTALETSPPDKDPQTQSTSGGDFMVDVLKTLDIDYLAMNCASSFRGLHEAVINYGKNVKPEILTCNHEEIAVAMGHGYAKMEGKPLAMICHGVVGIQHASMAMYNAWCDRVPVVCFGGVIIEANKRGNTPAEWVHAAIDIGANVRDLTKWDDQPASLQHFAESAVRAYKIATTPPMGPVLIALDAELQENPLPEEKLHIPKFSKVVPPQADSGAIAEVAKLLVNAEAPLIVVDRMARTQAGMDRLVELAETLQCAVVDRAGRTNFPSLHPLNHTGRRGTVVGQADVILSIELNDHWAALNQLSDRIVRTTHPLYKPGAKIITLGLRDMYLKANYQDFGRFDDIDISVAGDGEASLPALIEAVKKLIDPGRKAKYEARGKRYAAARLAMIERAKSDATIGWDSTPITVARMCAEVYAQIKDEDWSLVGNTINNGWPHRLWNIDRVHRWNGGSGGAGVGYNAPASLGGALANKRHGRLTVTFQGDGDLMFVPQTLWTAAHHKIPILYVVQNNRAYHQEVMYLQAMANRHGRGIEDVSIGTTITNPNVDFATVARGFGVYGEGPIVDPKDLGPALKRALDVVRRGEPALVDVITDPR